MRFAYCRCAAVVLGLGLLCGPRLDAALITSAGSLGGATVVDFSQFGPGYGFTSGPSEIGGLVGESITFTSTHSSVLGEGGYGFADNGSWETGFPGGAADGYSGLDTDMGSMTYTFNAGLVSGVGGFMNYAPGVGPDVLIEALGDGGVLLESYNINSTAPISTPGAINDGAFRGILRATADIRAFRVSNQFVALDDLTFTRGPQPVPEPASFALLSLGGLGAVLLRRRQTGFSAK